MTVELPGLDTLLTADEKSFRALGDSAPVLLWVSREDALCIFFNQTWLDFTGRTQAEEWGVGWAEGVHFEDLQRCMDTYLDAFNRRVPFEMEYRLRRKDGAYRWLLDRGIPRHAEDGRFLGFVGSCVDITERREAEEARRESEARLTAIIDSASDGILLVDPAGHIEAANPASARIFGHTQAALVGRPLAELVLDPTHPDAHELALVPSQGPRELTGVSADGTTLALELTSAPVGAGRTVIVRDVSARRSIERLVHEKGEEVQRRVGQDLHDGVGQLLTGIAFLSKSLEERVGARHAEVARRLVQLANQATLQVKTLAKGLCPIHLERDDLVAALRQLTEDTENVFHVPCRIHVEGAVAAGSINTSTQVYLIAREAITNALQHGKTPRLDLTIQRRGAQHELTISDEGVGFPAGPLPLGLGVRSMHHRARMIGGSLEIVARRPHGVIVSCRW